MHEDQFGRLGEWKGFEKRIFLELNTDNFMPPDVDLKRIGGFCIDLAHYAMAKKKDTIEYKFVMEHEKRALFGCNHLGGYDPRRNLDLHTIGGISDFEYLNGLPSFLFGDVIALEMFNPISEQVRYKEYIIKMLGKGAGQNV